MSVENVRSQTDKILEAVGRAAQQRLDEVQRLCKERPELVDIVYAITDSLLSELMYLCNFQKADGKPMLEVDTRIRKGVEETFQKLTGQPYMDRAYRHVWPHQWYIGGSHRVDGKEHSALTCKCGAVIKWSGVDSRLEAWKQEHSPHMGQ